MALVQKAFSDIITFSRTSNATRVGPTGRVEYAPHNLLTYSEEFDNAAWTKTAASISANVIQSPSGNVTADKLVEDSSTSVHYTSQSFSAVADTVYTFSAYVKAGERTRCLLLVAGGFSSAPSVDFNLTTGVIAVQPSGNSSSATISSVGNGWYRVTLTATASSTASSTARVYTLNASGTASYTGDGTSGIYLWGAQLAVGPYPLDYTPTTSAAVYGPRFDFDPVTLAARGLLIEEQRTNLLTYSEEFDNASFTKNGANVTANTSVSPDSTVTADSLIEDSSAGLHGFYPVVTITANIPYTYSVYAKAGTRSHFRMYIVDPGGSNGVYADVNLASAVMSAAVAIGTGGSAASSITSVGNGWYRCSVTGTPNGGITTITASLYMQQSYQGSISYNGDGTSGVYIWGAQLEAGAFPTSYIPTVASTVTRSADVASVDTLSPWYNETEGTIYTEYDIIGKTTTFGMASQIDDGTLDNRIVNIGQEFSSGDVKLGSFMNSGGSPSVNEYPITAMTVGSVYKLAFAVKSNDAAVVANGTAILDGTAVVPSGLTTLRLGSRITDGYLNGHLRRLAYYPRRLTDAELTALTA